MMAMRRAAASPARGAAFYLVARCFRRLRDDGPVAMQAGTMAQDGSPMVHSLVR